MRWLYATLGCTQIPLEPRSIPDPAMLFPPRAGKAT
jgi:hypothetical protein